MRFTHHLVAMAIAITSPLFAQQSLWKSLDEKSLSARTQERWIVPEKYATIELDVQGLNSLLERVPERTNSASEGTVIQLPMPDGSTQDFFIWEAPLMHPDLASKYRDIRTFSGRGVTNPASAAYLDWTPQGFHGMVMEPGRLLYIDPYYKADNTVYVSYDRNDYFNEKSQDFTCEVETDGHHQYVPSENMAPVNSGNRAVTNLRTYRLAIAANGEYTTYHGGTKPLALAAINTTLNRVRGIYETEMAISFTLIANNSDIIYTNSATDPYSNPPTLPQNQTNLDLVIGNSNYDMGHVFGTGGSGLATVKSVCSNDRKGRGMTSAVDPISDAFNVDYVAHEFGHQFGAHHTFNGLFTSNCTSANYHGGTAYEPGSGSTIMSYAGICGTQNLQRRANDYFHWASLNEMVIYVNSDTVTACGNPTPTTNNAPTVDANPTGMDGKTIPISTPFELTASGTDADGDVITYSWEELDLGTQAVPSNTSVDNPLFRSFSPTTKPTRSFPSLNDILDNTVSTSFSEKLSAVTRDMDFVVTVRDNKAGGGGYGYDNLTLHVSNAAGPFTITSQNTSAAVNSTITVTWNVANTNAAPISCANVDIMISLDGGATFTNLVTGTPNDGSQAVTLPNTATSAARIKVKCSDNVFFDITNADLRIVPDGAACAERVAMGNMSNYTAWTEESSNQGVNTILIYNWSNYHAASGSAYLGGYHNEVARLSQTITIPEAAHFANLEFWYRFVRTDCGSDVFNLKINGSIIKTYNMCNDPAANDWVRQLIDLSAYKGTSPTIMFEFITNSSNMSDLYIDDVSVYTCEGGAFPLLPVELIHFDAKAKDRTALLNWATASETNNLGFEVEMRTESGDFKNLGFVQGHGSVNTQNYYDFEVNGLTSGSHYFRLRQIDANGDANYSPIRQVFIKSETHVSVQPNPAGEVAHFVLSLETSEAVKLEILDGTGRVVGTVAEAEFTSGKFDFAYNTNDLPAGLYYYRLSGNVVNETGRFMVSK